MRYLMLLLTGKTAPELEDNRAIVRVRFQQGPEFPVDDVVIEAARSDETTPSLELAVAVRRKPNIVPSDEKMQELVVAFMQMLLRSSHAERGERIALVVAGPQTHAQQLEELAVLARNQADAEGFFALTTAPLKFSRALRGRLQSLSSLVHRALATLRQPNDDPAVARRTWELLLRLRVVMLRLEPPDVSDWADIQNELIPIARGGDLLSAAHLRDRLEVLASEFRISAATVDLPMLRRAVHPFLEVESWRNEVGWVALRRLEAQAFASARGTVGVGERAHHVDRTAAADDLLAAVRAARGLVVSGDSGVGKSALVLTAVSAAARAAPDALQVLCLNLRQLPETVLELEHALGSPLETLLAESSAPQRVLVVDAAEASTEQRREMFAHLLNAARSAEVKVVAITLTEVSKVIRGLLVTGIGGNVAEHRVNGLTDAELAAVAAIFPPLARVVANPRARELLRRLVAIDLLVRSHIDGAPVTDADALREIWDGLVRGREHPERGLPDARDRVLIRLATHQLQGIAQIDVGELDSAALDGLRRDGLLQAPADNPWQLLPEFSHDEVRRYAVARVLLSNLTPAEDLLAARAPRWALSAARLACQALLALPDSTSSPIQGRFAAVQVAFDALAKAGYGGRWGDLPAEALVTLGDPRPLLRDAWPDLRSGNGDGLRRLLRVVDQYHRSENGITDRVIVEPIIELLLGDPRPWALGEEVAALLRDWLRALAIEDAPAGQPLREQLRERLVAACAAGDADLAARRDAQAQARAARTPEEIEREAAFRRKRAGLLGEVGFPRTTRRTRTELPAELRNDTILELLALLGADIGESAEVLLRRVGREDPSELAPALEEVLTGRALAAYGRGLLADLTEAYYVDDDAEEGWSPLADGIRDHSARSFPIVPLSAWYRGPFLALLQRDFRRGVMVLNRLLNHAALFHARTSNQLDTQLGIPAGSAPDAYTIRLEVTGSARDYMGDDQVWRWYRGSGTGPYPCMSALQALERVCDQLIRGGASLERLVPVLVDGCENLAMLALVVGILVRHIERCGNLLDPYLAEPLVWSLEFTRSVAEMGGIKASSEGVEGAERRNWTLRDAAAWLALSAEPERAQQLRAVSDRLIAAAQSIDAARTDAAAGDRAEQREDSADASYVTTVRGWASALDRDRYAIETRDGATYLQNVLPQDVQAELGRRNVELLRVGESTRLVGRYGHVSFRAGGLSTPAGDAELAADLAKAKNLVERPPAANIEVSWDGPAAVAAAALEAHLLRGVLLPDENLRFAVEAILTVAERDIPSESWASEDSYFEQGADRSAARAVPLLLLPDAANLRDASGTAGVPGAERVFAAAERLTRALSNEVRLHFARGLDHVWAAACQGTPCIHEVALNLVVESMRDCALGPWDPMGQRKQVLLEEPVADRLARLAPRDILISRLDAAIRALGTVASRPTCVRARGQNLLAIVVDSQRRALRGYDRSIDWRGTHALVTVRALLMTAAIGDAAPIVAHIAAFADRPDLLAMQLLALAAAAEETPTAANAARQLWPSVVKQVLAFKQDGHSPFGADHFGRMALSALIPAPAGEAAFLYREIATSPIRWFDAPTWREAIESWLPRAVGCRDCVNALVSLVRTMAPEDQIAIGLPWVSQLALADLEAVQQRSLTAGWLIQIGPEVTGPSRTQWQQLVDALVVAGDGSLAPYSQ